MAGRNYRTEEPAPMGRDGDESAYAIPVRSALRCR